MTTAGKRTYIERRFRENAKIAGLWPVVLPTPGQLTILALEVIATGGDEPRKVGDQMIGYFRARMAFDDREYTVPLATEQPMYLDDLFDARWAGMMIDLWEAVQGESGNTYRNDRFLNDKLHEAVASDATPESENPIVKLGWGTLVGGEGHVG